jgi:hypothetical protein
MPQQKGKKGKKAVKGLDNLWFLSFVGESYSRDNLHWQGQVICGVGEGLFLIQLYEWLMGEPSVMRIVSMEEMRGWFFFESDEWMREYTEYHLPGGRKREQ